MSDLLTLCASLTARASDVSTDKRAMEIELSDGGKAVFLSDPDKGGFCAGGITDDAPPELKKTMGATLASLGLPMFSIPADKATDGVAEVIRQYEKGKQT